MAFYSANKPNKTLTLHKDNCPKMPRGNANSCGCLATGRLGNHEWFCENHITLGNVDQFMGVGHWAILLCNKCYR